MLYGLNSCNVKCQLHVSKAGKKKPKIKQNIVGSTTIMFHNRNLNNRKGKGHNLKIKESQSI